jgi:phage terminase small subunit
VNNDKLTVPAHLSEESANLYRTISESYELEMHHQKLLLLACEAFDRGREARKVLEESGLTTTDVRGVVRPHPCIALEQASRIQFLRLLREMNLDTTVASEVQPAPSLRQVRRG